MSAGCACARRQISGQANLMRPRTFLDENHFRQLQPLVALQRLVVELSAREIVARTNISRLNNISEMSHNCGGMLGIETGFGGPVPP